MMNREALVLFRVKLKSATAPGPLFSVSAMLNLKRYFILYLFSYPFSKHHSSSKRLYGFILLLYFQYLVSYALIFV